MCCKTVFIYLFLFFLTAFGSGLVAQTQIELRQATDLEAEGKWQEAISIYKDLIKREPSEQAYFLICNTLQANGEYEQVEDYLKDAIKEYPRQSDFSVRLFLLYKEWNKQKKADKQFEKILKGLRADNSDIQKVGNAFFRLRYFDQAEQIFLRGRQLLGDNSAYGYQLGEIFLQRGDYAAIAREYIVFLEQTPQRLSQIEANLSGLFAKDSINLIPTVQKAWEELYKRKMNDPYIAQFGQWLYIQSRNYPKALEMARTIDRKFENQSGEGLIEFAQGMERADILPIAEQAYAEVIRKGEENVFYQRALLGFTSVLYHRFSQNPNDKKGLERLLEHFNLVFSSLGYTRDCFETILQAAEVMAFHNNQVQEAVDLLEKCQKNNSFSLNQRGEFKLLSAELYHRFGDSWQASLFCSQVEQECKNSPLADRAKYFKAMLSYQNGEIEWALSQFKALRASTTKLIANDALEYSVLIEENRDEDSTFTAMRLFASAERERDWGNTERARQYLDTIRQNYLFHPLFDECIYLEALIAKDEGNIEMADSLLKNLLLKYPYDLTADDALMQLAQIAEINHQQPALAREYYETLILNHPTSLYVAQARKKLQSLSKR